VTNNIYLGVIIHDKHQDDDDIMSCVKSLYSRGNMLTSLSKTCSSKNYLDHSILCYAYGCHLWSTYKQYTHKRVVVAFNDIDRKLFGILRKESMSAIYVNNNIDLFEMLVRKNVYSLKIRLSATSNLLVQCIVSTLFYYHSNSCARWTKILNL